MHIEINFTRRKKTIEIQVLKDQHIRILAPKRTNKNDITKLLKKKQKWLEKKFGEARDRESYILERKYREGVEIPFLGRNLLLIFDDIVFPNSVKLDYRDICSMQEIHISLENFSTEEQMRSILIKQFIEYATIYLTTRTYEIAKRIKVKVQSIQVKSYKSRWGSCSVQAGISYNWKIIMAPVEIVDYLIIHELCHILEHNHSHKYWEHVRHFDPECIQHRAWLKKYGETLCI